MAACPICGNKLKYISINYDESSCYCDKCKYIEQFGDLFHIYGVDNFYILDAREGMYDLFDARSDNFDEIRFRKFTKYMYKYRKFLLRKKHKKLGKPCLRGD